MARKFPPGRVVVSQGWGHSGWGLGGSHAPPEEDDDKTPEEDDDKTPEEDDAKTPEEDMPAELEGTISGAEDPAELEDTPADELPGAVVEDRGREVPDPPLPPEALVDPTLEEAAALLLLPPLLLVTPLVLVTLLLLAKREEAGGRLLEPNELAGRELLCPSDEPWEVPLEPTLPLDPMVLPAAWQIPSALHT